MGHGKAYTDVEIAEIKSYLKDGCNNSEIAELTGRSLKAIQQLVLRMGWTHGRFNEEPKKVEPVPKQKIELVEVNPMPKTMIEDHEPKMEKTLKDFAPREIIKHLYNLGYRIEDNKLVCIVKQAVNLRDIING